MVFLGGLVSGNVQAQTAATPVLSPTSGTSYVQFNVTLTDATTGATIYYTLDRTTPTTSSTSVASGGTVPISQTETIKAMAVASGYTNSAVASASYQVTGQIAAGWYHTVILRSDGTVWTWGLNTSGQLGNYTWPSCSTPLQVSGLSGIVAVSTGHYHSVALKSDGTVWAWGLNNSGQLGDNTTTQRNSPVEVLKSNGSGGTTPLTGISAICSGAYHNLALDTSGNVWAWGLNSSGQLGDGTTTSRVLAEEITLPSGVSGQQLATGSYHSLLLTTSGAVEAWGLNANGQIGDGSTTQRDSPVSVTGLSGVTITALSGGEAHSLALAGDGTFWGWGWNAYGQVDGTPTQRNSPVHVSGLSNITGLLAEYNRSIFVKSDGTVWAWGYNEYGELGNSTVVNVAQLWLLQMVGVSGTVGVASGQLHTEVLKNDGTVWSCGLNNDGQLGSGFTDDNQVPVQLLTSDTYTALASSSHALMVKTDGTVWAMGDNTAGDLGDGTGIQRSSPVQVPGLSGVTAVAAGLHSMALESNGTVWCWGANAWRELGNGSYFAESSPVQAGVTTTGFTNLTAISAGSDCSYALKGDGTVWAWGENNFGELGTSSVSYSGSPLQISGLSGIKAISAAGNGSDHAMALDSSGHVWVWGGNAWADLGNGGGSEHASPEEELLSDGVTPLSNIVAIQAGQYFSMAIDSSGNVWCWGENDTGQLGDGTTNTQGYPEMLTGISGVKKFLCSSDYHTTVLKNDGTIWCWGPNWNGELGLGNTTTYRSPVQSPNYVGANGTSPGQWATLILKEDGHIEGSGLDDYSIMGICNYATPFVLPGISSWATVPTPTVSITAPANNTTVVQGTSQTFTASASETGGSIAGISFYINSNLVGSGTLVSTSGSTSIYAFTWTPNTWGSYTFAAVATDTNSHTSYRSPTVTVDVPYDSDNGGAGNGLPDWWELKYFGHLGNSNSASPDGNGDSLLQDYQNGLDPTNYYSQLDGSGHPTIITPTLTINSGNNQLVTPGAFADLPLGLVVTNSNGGAILPNAPLTFAVASGGGLISAASFTTPGETVSLTTDSTGLAQVVYQAPTGNNVTGTISATANGHSATFSETTTAGDGTYDAPSNATSNLVSPIEIDLTWVNHATSATCIIIQQSTDNVNWTTIATLSDPTATSYAVTSGIPVGSIYHFRIEGDK